MLLNNCKVVVKALFTLLLIILSYHTIHRDRFRPFAVFFLGTATQQCAISSWGARGETDRARAVRSLATLSLPTAVVDPTLIFFSPQQFHFFYARARARAWPFV